MIHDLDLVLSLVKDQIKDIQASGASVVSDYIDLANARISFKNGVTANLTASRISNKQIREMRIFEKHQYTKINFNERIVTQNKISHQKIQKNKILINDSNALFVELQSFANSIINKSKVAVSGNDGLRALEIATNIQNIIERK